MKQASDRQGKRPSKPLLYEGKRMKQPEFHRAYDLMPDNYRAELIAGVVHEPSPEGWSHCRGDRRIGNILDTYAIHTPGVECGGSGTVILSSEDEVQPDGILLILPGFGGKSQFAAKRSSKSRTPVQYVKGPPELVAEIADTSRRIDLGKKKNRYACCGITEYIVMSVRPKRLYWFNLQTGHELKADSDGIFRSEVFPGLWIHAKALLDHDGLQSMKTLEQGLASDEHAQFVAKLAAARRD